MLNIHSLTEAYQSAKDKVIAHGFASEIEWQASCSLDAMTESEFLSQAAWIVLNSGMREAVVRKRFDAITTAFCGWLSAARIVECTQRCVVEASKAFNHQRKIKAIIEVCRRVAEVGWDTFKQRIKDEGLPFLRTLPFVGPVTQYHLAKNIGFDVAKPDRHLTRISEAVGFPNVQSFCEAISGATGDKVAVVDLVLWRYATLIPNYLRSLCLCGEPC